MLGELGIETAASQDADVHALALTDGSLIYWFLEQIPVAYFELLRRPCGVFLLCACGG